MSSINAILICLALAFGSLIVVSIVNRAQLRRRLVSQKTEQMKRRILELEELSALLEPLVESIAIVRVIQEDIIDLIQLTKRLAPKSHYLEANLMNAEQRLDALRSSGREHEMWRLQTSDAAIARAHYALNEAGRIIRRRQEQGKLEIAETEMFISELGWAYLMVTAVTLIGQGHKAMNRGDVLKARPFYKKALQVLAESNHTDERRHQFVKELNDILANKRKALSLQLMPESDFNPTHDSADLRPPPAASA